MHNLSRAVTTLEMQRYDSDGELALSALGTGFFWRHKDQWLIVTNWHNVTGLNADTGKLEDSKFHPTDVKFSVLQSLPDEENQAKRVNVTSPLYKNNEPLWIEHPSRRQIDVVAIPIEIQSVDRLVTLAINEIHLDEIPPVVGMDCFIIGYPIGLRGLHDTPIWKRASIATEPSLNHDRKKMLLVDTATREGMSGSPVVLRHEGLHMPNGIITADSAFGTFESLLGIYSGRIGVDGMGAQLGRVWKAEVIMEILSEGLAGVDPVFAL